MNGNNLGGRKKRKCDFFRPLSTFHHYLYLYHRNMEVFFPKFKLDQKYEMHELLKQMGIRRLFSPWADLGELSVTARNLKVSKVSQDVSLGPKPHVGNGTTNSVAHHFNVDHTPRCSRKLDLNSKGLK